MKIAVIGAGTSGLCSVHQIKKNIPNAEVIGFEISRDLGGNWLYTDKTGFDEFGIPITSSVYKNLRTNLPKQVMAFSDYPIPDSYDTFIKNADYLKYLQNYAEHFDLKKHFKFQHIVTLIKPVDDKWLLFYKPLTTGVTESMTFDYIFVCNGRYIKMKTSTYKGADIFKGGQIHSHNYRIPDIYKDKNVLIVGSGSSGLDISTEVATIAKRVYLSHHKVYIPGEFPDNFIKKPDVKELTETSVKFIDDTSEEVDEIIYCTGYQFDFPFLDPECGIKLESEIISHLYRHIVNIERTSMFFIGVPQVSCAIPMRDMQAKYCTAIITNEFKLPSKEVMLEHTKVWFEHKSNDEDSKCTHVLGSREPQYYNEMAQESGIPSIPLVFHLIRAHTASFRKDVYKYRNYEFEIIDDEHFIMKYKQ